MLDLAIIAVLWFTAGCVVGSMVTKLRASHEAQRVYNHEFAKVNKIIGDQEGHQGLRSPVP